MNKETKFYAAPMEGITGYVYRNAHRHYFHGVDKYFTPFLTPKQGKGWTSKEKNDVMPEHNRGVFVVPQILTNRADDFVRMATQLEEIGYEEVNLNLGCPSRTVTAKGKGSGFLAEPEELRRFFDQVFSRVTVKVSVKSRLGVERPEEVHRLMEIYNEFPLCEVILHARVQKDLYKKPVNREGFRQAFLLCGHPMCYNGDIYTKKDYEDFSAEFASVNGVMCGRGMLANPELPERIKARELPGGIQVKAKETEAPLDRMRWKGFHDEVCRGYEEIMSGERNVLFKMKELWSYMITSFPEGKQYGKKIRKVTRLSEYKKIVEELFLS